MVTNAVSSMGVGTTAEVGVTATKAVVDLETAPSAARDVGVMTTAAEEALSTVPAAAEVGLTVTAALEALDSACGVAAEEGLSVTPVDACVLVMSPGAARGTGAIVRAAVRKDVT
jgi:hypothetical protein